MKRSTQLGIDLALGGAILLLAGCKGIATKGEKEARNEFSEVQSIYRPDNARPVLPELTADPGLSNHLVYALLNSRRVEATYHDWSASVERITVERSLPDPQVTFQMDIMDTVTSVMPGFMQMFPGPGKLSARANLATAESQSRYFAFESAVLAAAFELKRAYYELHFLDEQIRINQENLTLLNELEQTARAQSEAGNVTLQDVLRAQIERDRVATDILNLEDSRHPKYAAFKAALGMTTQQENPPVPIDFESTDLGISDEELLQIASQQNPELKELHSEIRAMEAEIAVAYKQNVPDFSLGLMADVQANPTMFRPLTGMTLPVWRDKVAAGIASATARQLAAESRLTQREIDLTVNVAERTFAYRELNRNLTLLQQQLIPKARMSVEIARAGYLSGTISFFNLIDAERQQLGFQLEEVEARIRREIVLAELSLIIAGIPPQGAPLLEQYFPPTPDRS